MGCAPTTPTNGRSISSGEATATGRTITVTPDRDGSYGKPEQIPMHKAAQR